MLATYLGIAIFLVWVAHVFLGDALSRVDSADRVLFSRDPHLAAIGFVWNPLPALAMLPLVALKGIWPALVTQGFAANIASALFMAGAVYQTYSLLREINVTWPARLVVTGTFALHPLILFYGANGMSEASFLFFIVLACRYLALWLSSPSPGLLAVVGLGLAGAYLCRYEAMAAGCGVILLVGLATIVRSPGNRGDRLIYAICDCLLVGAPFLLAVGFWAGTSWLITGHPFEQFSSVYGNAAQVRAIGVPTRSPGFGAVLFAMRGIGALEPFLPLAILAAVAKGLKSVDVRVLAVLAVYGPVLLFMSWAYGTGTVPTFLRYLIVSIPGATLLWGFVLSSGDFVQPARNLVGSRVLKTSMTLGLLVMSAVAVPLSISGMTDGVLNATEADPIGGVVAGHSATAKQQSGLHWFETDREVARYVDNLHLKEGSVLLDDFLGFAVAHGSSDPRQFIITSDRDFKQALNDPTGLGVEYLLVPDPAGIGKLDALNRTYPDIYVTGAGVGQLVTSFQSQDPASPNWRLYRVITGS
jgi:hypothetical protein